MSVRMSGAAPLTPPSEVGCAKRLLSVSEAANVQCESDEPRRVKKKRRRKLSQPKSSQDGTASEYTDEGEASCDDEETPIAIPQHEEAPEERVAPAEEETKIPLSVHEQNGCDETKCDDSDRAEDAAVPKFDLKPDAEEFIPQAYRNPEPPPGIQFVNFPPSFVPIPIMGEIPPPQYPPPFLPPGIPINFVPPNAKIVPNFVNFVATPNFVPKAYPPAPPEQSPVEEEAKEEEVGEENKAEERLNVENKQHFVTPNEVKVQKIPNKTDIDIEKIVSKLEEAAKEQRMNENKRQNFNKFNNKPRYHHQDNRQNQHKTGNFKRRENDQERFSKNRNFVRKTNEHIHSKQNHVTDPENSDTAPSTPRKAATQNYSATLKRCPRFERHQQQGKVEEALQEPAAMVQTAKKPPAPTQWISVASRKKRKNNKGVSESEEAEVFQEEETEATLQEDGFESYDPNQLVDVVPPTQVIEIVVEPPKVEESDIPKEAIVSVEEETVKPSVEVEMPKEETDEKKEEEEISKPQEEVPPKTVTRKAKKKLQTKRIIIKDTYMVTPEVTEPKKPEVAKKEEAPPPTPPVEVEEDTKQITTSDPVVTAIASESPVSTPEKRTKRKKKKPAKLPSVSVSSSNTTLNNLDDSYDFLLEPSVLDESEDKTNVEISQELDRLIQKGMYNNLEEKIKSLNVSFPNDNFFSSINLTSPLTFEKNNFLKANDFASLLKPTTNLLTKPKEDFGKLNIDFSRIKIPVAEPQPSTSKTGIFLENPEVNEILKNTGNEIPKLDVPASLEVPLKKSKSTGKLKNKSKKQVDAKPEGEEQNKTSSDSEEKTKLYPITQAVKNWMTKTRENTPEVDILKSPKTIKKELCEVCEDEAKVVAESEEEVVLFPKEDWEGSVEQDLLDCWENDPKLSAEDAEKPQEEVKLNGNFVNGTKKLTNGKTSEDEEVLEIYESKYGKNEDFLKLQAEIDEKKRKLNGNFPKHGNLPYRAICCSIM